MQRAARVPIRQDADILSPDPKEFTVEELRKILSGESDRLPKVVAVSVLRRKDYPEKEKIADLERVLRNEQESPRLRHAAAVELGRLGSPAAAATLRSALKFTNEFVRRGVAQSLQLLGEEVTTTVGEQVSPATGAALLVLHLRSAPGVGVPFPESKDLLAPARAALAVKVQKANPEEAARAAHEAVATELGLHLLPESALAVRCLDRTLLYLPTQDAVQPDGPQRLLGKNGVAGVVVVRYTYEVDVWSVKYFVLTQPSGRDKELRILLATDGGVVAFAGTAEIDGKRARFSLQTVKHPGAVAARIEGLCQGGAIQLTQVRSDARRSQRLVPQVRRREPR
jgi:hypothetical protein